MMTLEDRKSYDRINKIISGLEIVYEKLLEEKKAKNSELVILRDNKIVMVRP
jgi:hypothetical protein